MPPPGLPTRSPPRNGLPAWAWLLIAAGLAVVAWLIEGRKGAKAG